MPEISEKISKSQYIRPGKLNYLEKSYWQMSYSGELTTKVKKSAHIKEGELLTHFPKSKETVAVQYEGKLLDTIAEGAIVKKDQVISVSGKIVKKQILSPVSGKVVSVDTTLKEMKVEIDENPNISKENFKPLVAPIDAKVADILHNQILLEFSCAEINLFALKGQSTMGKLFYAHSDSLKKKDHYPDKLRGSILVTDTVTAEMYPHLSAMGVAGLILNHIEYELFYEIVTFLMPIGVISGFGNLNEDAKLVKYFSSMQTEEASAIIDSKFNRLLILNGEKSSWLKNYHFDLEKSGIV